jgi:hypothetical protein
VCLSYGDESLWYSLPAERREALIEECMAYGRVLERQGQGVGGMALESATKAKTVRAKNGKVIVTDGPYAETKELLGGVAIFKFRNMDHAVQAWSNHPSLRLGEIFELRPVAEEFEARWEERIASGQAVT